MAQKALYATNVYHYDHVVMAMNEIFEDVELVRRFEISPSMLKRTKGLRFPEPLIKLLSRRMRHPSSLPSSTRSLGVAQVALPSLMRLGIGIRPSHVRMVTSAYAATVAKAARGKDVLHFVEGLGYRALRTQSFGLAICERRNFHHSVFEEALEPQAGFPLNAKRDPIGDILDSEYELSNYILVYSQAAKESFTDRGFDSSRILVAPIGIGPQLSRLSLARDRHRLAYVGRGDIHKGIDVAVAAVREMGYPYRLTVAGPMAPEVKAWLSEHKHVDYVGILDREGLRRLYSTAGAMLLPSTESYGLAAAEAAFHGLPIVCSNFTGIAEYLPASSYSVVFGRDPRDWAERGLEVVSNDRRDTSADVNFLAGLDLNSTADQLKDLYFRIGGRSSN